MTLFSVCCLLPISQFFFISQNFNFCKYQSFWFKVFFFMTVSFISGFDWVQQVLGWTIWKCYFGGWKTVKYWESYIVQSNILPNACWVNTKSLYLHCTVMAKSIDSEVRLPGFQFHLYSVTLRKVCNWFSMGQFLENNNGHYFIEFFLDIRGVNICKAIRKLPGSKYL